MNYEYEYRASQALQNKEFRFIKMIYSIIILGALAYGIKKIISGDYVMGNFFLIAALLNTLSPLTFFNFLGEKSPLDFYFLIHDKTIKYKLSIFSTAKTVQLDEVERIGYAEQTIAIKFKKGHSQYIEANKIFGKAKQEELKKWIKKFSRKR
jgi:hypothetical protein